MVAIGSAITDGERELECLVGVRGENGEEILPPCGNCRQFLSDYMPDCKVKDNNIMGLLPHLSYIIYPFQSVDFVDVLESLHGYGT